MVYKHPFFTLDTDSRLVADENGKELRLTGNAFRVLVYLCANKSATLTQIGGYLDHAKDFDENHIRQYRYRINTIIGHDVVTYFNSMYAIEGEIKNIEKSEGNDRNTVLLQSSPIKSEHDPIIQKVMKASFIPAVGAAILLLLNFFSWPYTYYTILRIVVTGVAVYYAYISYKSTTTRDVWFWILVVIAVVFNPLVPIYLNNKSVWSVIDVITALLMVVSANSIRRMHHAK